MVNSNFRSNVLEMLNLLMYWSEFVQYARLGLIDCFRVLTWFKFYLDIATLHLINSLVYLFWCETIHKSINQMKIYAINILVPKSTNLAKSYGGKVCKNDST